MRPARLRDLALAWDGSLGGLTVGDRAAVADTIEDCSSCACDVRRRRQTRDRSWRRRPPARREPSRGALPFPVRPSPQPARADDAIAMPRLVSRSPAHHSSPLVPPLIFSVPTAACCGSRAHAPDRPSSCEATPRFSVYTQRLRSARQLARRCLHRRGPDALRADQSPPVPSPPGRRPRAKPR